MSYNERTNSNERTPWSESASELNRPSDRRFSAKWLPTFADKGFHVVSVMSYNSSLNIIKQQQQQQQQQQHQQQQQQQHCGLSPHANYTDRATAACRRS
jgi:hypothetical protein